MPTQAIPSCSDFIEKSELPRQEQVVQTLRLCKFLNKIDETPKTQEWLDEGVAKMIKFSRYFADQVIVDFLKAEKPSQLRLLLSQWTAGGTEEEIAGILLAMILCGEINGFSSKFALVHESKREGVLDRLQLLLYNFSQDPEVIRWILHNWRHFKHKQHKLITVLNRSEWKLQSYFFLQLSTFVSITDNDYFFLFAESASRIDGFQEMVESNLERHSFRPELSCREFQELVEQMRQDKNQRILSSHTAAMINTRVDKWLPFIEEKIRDSLGLQADNLPLQSYVDELSFLFGDLREGPSRAKFINELEQINSKASIYNLKFDLHRIKPSAFQLAVSLFIASSMNQANF